MLSRSRIHSHFISILQVFESLYHFSEIVRISFQMDKFPLKTILTNENPCPKNELHCFDSILQAVLRYGASLEDLKKILSLNKGKKILSIGSYNANKNAITQQLEEIWAVARGFSSTYAEDYAKLNDEAVAWNLRTVISSRTNLFQTTLRGLDKESYTICPWSYEEN